MLIMFTEDGQGKPLLEQLRECTPPISESHYLCFSPRID